MRLILLSTLAMALAGPALAQTASPGEIVRYDTAPWWMAQPVIASTGAVQTEIPANRAKFSATFQVVHKDAAEATRLAAEQVRALGLALIAPGPDKIRLQTVFRNRPLYEQYRDKDGNRIENQRADKIERYEVNATLEIEVRDLALLEKVYAAVLVSKPSNASEVDFQLEAGADAKTEMFEMALQDARRRAEVAVRGAGAKLGPVRLIDPAGRACQTDVLVAGAPRIGGGGAATRVPPPRSFGIPSGAIREPEALPGGPPGALNVMDESLRASALPLQPPLRELRASACIVFGLE